jgi:beta-glucanase (GH16 family)
MNRSTALRAACIALAASSLAAGCGGGAAPSEAAALPGVATAAAAAPAAAAPAAPPAPASQAAPAAAPAGQPSVELATNGNFTLGLSHWGTQNAALAPSSRSAGGQMLDVAGTATQPIAAGQLVAGQSYTLQVTARLQAAGPPAQVGVQFRRPAGAEPIRHHHASVATTVTQTYRVDFTAPPYAAMAEITLTAGGAHLLVEAVSLQAREAIAQTEPRMSTWDSHVPWGYVLEFNDEFSGSTLNRSKWFTRYIYAGGTLDRLGDEQQRYRDNDNHRVAGGVLSLVARKVTQNDPAGVNYESGMIRSDWTARYGYFEARVKMPQGIGLWPAFWLASDVSATGAMAWPPEIDIFEFVNNGVEDRANMLHAGVVPLPGVAAPYSYVDPGFNTEWSFYTAPYNFHDGWHTVGAEWTPTSVTVYLDGKKLFTRSYLWNFPDGSAAGPAHILLNLAVGGAWAGRHGIDDTALPQALQIDWVRAYSKPH